MCWLSIVSEVLPEERSIARAGAGSGHVVAVLVAEPYSAVGARQWPVACSTCLQGPQSSAKIKAQCWEGSDVICAQGVFSETVRQHFNSLQTSVACDLMLFFLKDLSPGMQF